MIFFFTESRICLMYVVCFYCFLMLSHYFSTANKKMIFEYNNSDASIIDSRACFGDFFLHMQKIKAFDYA